MKPVILESPYKGDNWEDTEENIRFGRLCMNDCLVNHNEAPFPSHLLYTLPGVLEDKIESERNLGMNAGFNWKARADGTVVYINRGISVGMHGGIRRSIILNQDFKYRILSGYPNSFLRPRICTVTGASGVGKTRIMRKLLDSRPLLRVVRSFTSRSRRDSDLPGEYRYNVPAEKFAKKFKDFLWIMEAHGNHYATHKRSISTAINPPKGFVAPRFMTLVPSAVAILREYLSARFPTYKYPILSFYILSPDEDEIRDRLAHRGDDEESIRRRVEDCRQWDEEALKSDIPYIFIQNNKWMTGINNAVDQISLFL